jgi:hypothetical protein
LRLRISNWGWWWSPCRCYWGWSNSNWGWSLLINNLRSWSLLINNLRSWWWSPCHWWWNPSSCWSLNTCCLTKSCLPSSWAYFTDAGCCVSNLVCCTSYWSWVHTGCVIGIWQALCSFPVWSGALTTWNTLSVCINNLISPFT